MALPSSPKRQRRRCWLLASTSTKYVTTRSKVGWFKGHWKGGAKRCPGEDSCTICASGAALRLFTYVFVEDEHGEVLVFEIPERLKELAERLDDNVGTSLAISREGTNRNSAILMLEVGTEHVEELDIFRFVDTLGHDREVGISTQPSSESFSTGSTRTPVP